MSIKVKTIENSLHEYANENFDNMFNIAPADNGVVQVVNKETGEYEQKPIFRKYKSYLKQVPFDKNTGKSYMFGADEPTCDFIELPDIFRPFMLEGYNQCTVNWYKGGVDYIEPHGDCIAKLERGSNIVVISVNRNKKEHAIMNIYNTNGTTVKDIPLMSGTLLEMSQGFQVDYRHGVKVSDYDRISITLRAVK